MLPESVVTDLRKQIVFPVMVLADLKIHTGGVALHIGSLESAFPGDDLTAHARKTFALHALLKTEGSDRRHFRIFSMQYRSGKEGAVGEKFITYSQMKIRDDSSVFFIAP